MRKRIKLTKKQRLIRFFYENYSTGMELPIFLNSYMDKDIEDGIDWIDGKVELPKYLDEVSTNDIYIVRGINGELLYATIDLSDEDKNEIRSMGLYIDTIDMI